MSNDQVFIELDGRRRASLGRIGRHDRYLAHEERDGTIVLTPAVVMTAAESWVNSDPDLVEQITRAVIDPQSRSSRRGRPQRKG